MCLDISHRVNSLALNRPRVVGRLRIRHADLMAVMDCAAVNGAAVSLGVGHGRFRRQDVDAISHQPDIARAHLKVTYYMIIGNWHSSVATKRSTCPDTVVAV